MLSNITQTVHTTFNWFAVNRCMRFHCPYHLKPKPNQITWERYISSQKKSKCFSCISLYCTLKPVVYWHVCRVLALENIRNSATNNDKVQNYKTWYFFRNLFDISSKNVSQQLQLMSVLDGNIFGCVPRTIVKVGDSILFLYWHCCYKRGHVNIFPMYIHFPYRLN